MPDQKAIDAERRLKAAQAKARRKKAGPPLNLTDADLDAEAQVKQSDVDRALAFWRQNAPAGFKDLLDAEVVE